MVHVLNGVEIGQLLLKPLDSAWEEGRKALCGHFETRMLSADQLLGFYCWAIGQLSKWYGKFTFLISSHLTVTRMLYCCFRYEQIFNSSHTSFWPGYLSRYSWMWNNHWYLQRTDWSWSKHSWRSGHFVGGLEKYM